jgi:type II secretory ATPase GspE/PulE/Tfp pilus assembly ATPase PilB-like protein
MAQRLVRRLCPACRRERAATTAEAALLARHDQPSGPVFDAVGCKACHHTGYRGRLGIFELFTCDGEIEEMIVAGRRDGDIRRHLASHGMKPLLADGFAKVLQGVTTLSELERAVAG